jgi:hypothetical protein
MCVSLIKTFGKRITYLCIIILSDFKNKYRTQLFHLHIILIEVKKGFKAININISITIPRFNVCYENIYIHKIFFNYIMHGSPKFFTRKPQKISKALKQNLYEQM